MGLLSKLADPRVVLGALSGTTSMLIGLAAFTNVVDFDTNYQFVKHVLAMDTTFGAPGTSWRAITSPALVLSTYVAIIVWEFLIAVLLACGTVAWFRSAWTVGGGTLALSFSTAGWLMQVVLFGAGFLVIGGEWFQMWQSADWNGMDAAFRNFLTAVACLTYAYVAVPREERRDVTRTRPGISPRV